jgi:hypothetical protein
VLCLCVPTYDRAPRLRALLEVLEREIGDRDDVVVLVSDNASPDATPEVLVEAAARLPWLRVHRQPENVGPFANTRWLVEHAPDAEYLWTFGDDDLPYPGTIDRTIALLREHRPAWLFHPYEYVDGDGARVGAIPLEDGGTRRFADARALWAEWHQYLTFMSASVVRADALRAAARATTATNAYLPLLWFFRAGLDGPCVSAGAYGLSCCGDISWGDLRDEYVTLHYTSLYDDGLRLGMTAAEFGESLNGLYTDGFGREHWRRVPIERLAAVVRRFPQCAATRTFLWDLACAQGRADVLADLDAGCRAIGLHDEAERLRVEGEAAFHAGRTVDAARRFEAAATLVPTLPGALNDLAVALHHAGHPQAAVCARLALFVDPSDADAQENLRAIEALAA